MKKKSTPKAVAPPSLDASDLEILKLLQTDARMPNAEIGRRVGLVASAVFQRVRKLQDQGVIIAHETRVKPRAVSLGLAAFLFVKVDDRVGDSRVAHLLAELPEVQELHHIAGEDCYLLKVRVQDTESLGQFLREKIGVIDSVRSTKTTIVLETIKETGNLPLQSGLQEA